MKHFIRATFLATLIIAVSGPTVYGLGTTAGTVISNQAKITYQVGSVSGLMQTSTDPTGTDPDGKTLVTVAQLVDVDVTLLSTTPVEVEPGDTNRGLTFRITNTGNGLDSFSLTFLSTALAGDNFDPSAVNIFFDDPGSNDGVFGTDDLAAGNKYILGTNDPSLAKDAFVIVHIVNDIPSTGLSDGDTGDSQLTATSNTLTGTAGTNVSGGGVGGVDVCVGFSEGDDSAIGTYVVVNIVVVVTKAAAIEDLFNPGNFAANNKPLPGAKIRYTVTVQVTGDPSVTAESVTFTDDIPVNTTYVAESVTLQTIAKTDAGADSDGVVVSGGTVTVALGNLTSASAMQNITFLVTID